MDDKEISSEELKRYMKRIEHGASKEELLADFLKKDVPGIQVYNSVDIKTLLGGRRQYVIHNGKVCHKPVPVSGIDIATKDDNVVIKVRSGDMFILNMKKVLNK